MIKFKKIKQTYSSIIVGTLLLIPVCEAKDDPFAVTDIEVRDLLTVDQAQRKVFNDGLKRAIEISIARNPRTKLDNSLVSQKKYDVNIARSAKRPSLNYDASVGREYGDILNSRSADKNLPNISNSLIASQLLTDFGATSSDIKSAKEALLRTKNEAMKSREEITSEVIKAYLNVAEQRDLLFAADTKIAAQERVLKLVEASSKSGNATSADVSRTKARLSFSRFVLKDIESKLYIANDEFYRLLAYAPGYLQSVKDISNYLRPTLEANLAQLSKGNYELQSLAASIRSAKYAMKSVKASRLPKIFLNGAAKRYENQNGIAGKRDQLNANISLKYTIYNGGRRRSEIKQKLARITESKARYNQALMRITYQLRTNWRAFEKSINLKDLTASRVNESSKVADLYEAQFKAGKRTLFELIDSQDDLYNARSEEIANRYARLRASYSLLQLQGVLFNSIVKEDNVDVANVSVTCSEYSTNPECISGLGFAMPDEVRVVTNNFGRPMNDKLGEEGSVINQSSGVVMVSLFDFEENNRENKTPNTKYNEHGERLVENNKYLYKASNQETQQNQEIENKSVYDKFVISNKNYNELDDNELNDLVDSLLNDEKENQIKMMKNNDKIEDKTEVSVNLDKQFNTPYKFDDLGEHPAGVIKVSASNNDSFFVQSRGINLKSEPLVDEIKELRKIETKSFKTKDAYEGQNNFLKRLKKANKISKKHCEEGRSNLLEYGIICITGKEKIK